MKTNVRINMSKNKLRYAEDVEIIATSKGKPKK